MRLGNGAAVVGSMVLCPHARFEGQASAGPSGPTQCSQCALPDSYEAGMAPVAAVTCLLGLALLGANLHPGISGRA